MFDKSYCSVCKQETKHSLLFEKLVDDSIEGFISITKFQTIECMGCENVSFRMQVHDDTMVGSDETGQFFEYHENHIYPLSIKKHNALQNRYVLPMTIRTVYEESIDTFKNNCFLLAGVGFRAVIEAICIDQDISGHDLEKKIKGLLKKNLITSKEEKRLHSIRFLGNDSVHEMKVPTESQLLIVLEIVDHLLKNLYLIDANIKGKLDEIIDTYPDFKVLIWQKFKKREEVSEVSIKILLGKDYRKVRDNIDSFEKTFIGDISKGIIKFVTLGNEITENEKKAQSYLKVGKHFRGKLAETRMLNP